MQSAYNDNKVNAQDTYIGKVYTVTGYISEIESEYVSIVSSLCLPPSNFVILPGYG